MTDPKDSWLRKRIDADRAGNGGDPPDTEAIAREFAERALRREKPYIEGVTLYARDVYDRLIAEAIAATDKEET